MVAANPNQNGNPNQDTGVKPHPERIARKLKKNFTLHVLATVVRIPAGSYTGNVCFCGLSQKLKSTFLEIYFSRNVDFIL